MRIPFGLAAVLVFAAGAAFAEDGQYSGPLIQALTATASGQCPREIMADQLLSACRQQAPTLGPALAAMGRIVDATLVSSQQTPNGMIETYRVRFSGGQTMTWAIGAMQDGKFTTIVSSGG